MRSRFSAYALGKVDYLIQTTSLAGRDALDREELKTYCRNIRCVGLKILAREAGGPGDETGTVKFHASLQVNGKRHLHVELSRFVREEGCWRYVDGDSNEAAEERLAGPEKIHWQSDSQSLILMTTGHKFPGIDNERRSESSTPAQGPSFPRKGRPPPGHPRFGLEPVCIQGLQRPDHGCHCGGLRFGQGYHLHLFQY
jgi:SEC-C motif-containing protein